MRILSLVVALCGLSGCVTINLNHRIVDRSLKELSQPLEPIQRVRLVPSLTGWEGGKTIQLSFQLDRITLCREELQNQIERTYIRERAIDEKSLFWSEWIGGATILILGSGLFYYGSTLSAQHPDGKEFSDRYKVYDYAFFASGVGVPILLMAIIDSFRAKDSIFTAGV